MRFIAAMDATVRSRYLGPVKRSLPLSTATAGRCLDSLESERRHPALTVDGKRIASRLRSLLGAGKVLDVGAGDGFHSQALIAAGYEVHALEPSPEAREVFRRINGFEPQNGFLDSAFAQSHEQAYDAILLSQVLEHLPDPNATANHLRQLLRPGGVAAIAVPHFRSWLSRIMGRHDMFISPPEHLNYFAFAGLVRLMSRHGFDFASSETVTWFDPDRVAARARPRALGRPMVGVLRLFFAAADRMHRGNTLEAYFRRPKDRP